MFLLFTEEEVVGGRGGVRLSVLEAEAGLSDLESPGENFLCRRGCAGVVVVVVLDSGILMVATRDVARACMVLA